MKFKTTREELANYSIYIIPDTLILEGEAVEEEADCVYKNKECQVCPHGRKYPQPSEKIEEIELNKKHELSFIENKINEVIQKVNRLLEKE